MIRVYVSSVVDAAVDRVWVAVRDFNGLPKWNPLVKESYIGGGLPADRVGCLREIVLQDGNHAREQLLALSDYDYRVTWSIVESVPGVENHAAEIKLTPVTDSKRTFVEGTENFAGNPSSVVGERRFRAGFDELKRLFGGQ